MLHINNDNRLFTQADTENFSQSLVESNSRRKKLSSGKPGGSGIKLTKMSKAMLITSPLNMMKQDLFSQTGKFNE
jgi:hypothetical protein